jgi:hypothetical protein
MAGLEETLNKRRIFQQAMSDYKRLIFRDKPR